MHCQDFLTIDFNTYVTNISHHGTFGDHRPITLMATAVLLDIQIVVISSNSNFPPRLSKKIISGVQQNAS